MKIAVNIYMFDWTSNEKVDVSEFDQLDEFTNLAGFYLKVDSFEIDYRGLAELKEALKKEVHLQNKMIIELEYSRDCMREPCEEIVELFKTCSRYFIIKDDNIVEVPMQHKEVFDKMSFTRLGLIHFCKHLDVVMDIIE